MYPQQIHEYLRQFFNENKCPIINENEHYLNIQLTIDMDKKIMNRPFYWKYIESVNETPNPAQITLITDIQQLKEGVKGEVVHFGSPRLHQLFRVTKEMGSFVKMYEQVHSAPDGQMILTPWLGVNYKISYCSHQTKETLYSLGINLMTGAVFQEFQERLTKLDLVKDSPEQVFNLPYIITPVRALDRLDAVVDQMVREEDQTWAEEAKKRWQKDQAVLDYFYEGQDEKPECYEIEKNAMEERFKPRITIEVLNGGLFYLIGDHARSQMHK
ncbi:YqhG family protein [Sporosarcina obsidiansis]|uniref:YqhG family protein n=1 Tax=Sporosarcina obsidiansis TaxID=2660748 RepID=UPI00129B64A1|nr:YqhG family protein [Sporosarcina obsidiansis]